MAVCEIDTKQLERQLAALDEQERANAIFASLKKGGAELVDKTRDILIRKMPNATSKKSYNKSVAEGVHLGKSDKAYLEVLVTLFGDFRTKWFETGTEERYLRRTGAKDRDRGKQGDRRFWKRKIGKENQYKKGTYRGKIKDLHFFRDARQQYGKEILDKITESLAKEINKILNKTK